GLVQAGHEVLLYGTGDSSVAGAELAYTFDEAVGVGAGGAPAEARHVLDAYRYLELWMPDVVHDHTIVGPLCAGERRYPIFTTNHGPFDSDLGTLYRAVC